MLIVFLTNPITAQDVDNPSLKISRLGDLPFDSALAPFYHGVASGDPLSDAVVIWTRVTPEDLTEEVEVDYFVSSDPAMLDEIITGTVLTGPDRDYTVKIDLTGLESDQTYYYRFAFGNVNSIVGRTKTASSGEEDHIRFGVVSCSNYQAGYFNAYARLAERGDLDLIVHLGDYIYEYGGGVGTYGYDESRADRINIPDGEILEVVDYRTRHSLYKLDSNLRAAHQQHPFLTIWDDHEFANDAYKDGAENHNEGEGDWNDRKANAKQVYSEWMPIRDGNTNPLYRKLVYGDLVDIIMLDTRVEGRDEQVTSVTDPEMYSEDRTILGPEQKQWLFSELEESEATWKVLANQVIFSEFHVGWAGALVGLEYDALESFFVDIWDGYPFERNQIIDHIGDNEIDNMVILTGDFHTTFAMDVAKFPSEISANDPLNVDQQLGYNAETQEGSIAVEFSVPSITSANFDENLDPIAAAFLQVQANNILPADDANFPGVVPNPHLKYVNLVDHGYYTLDLTPEKVQADYFFVDIFDPISTEEEIGGNYYSNLGDNHLTEADGPAPGKADFPPFAPELPFGTSGTKDNPKLAVFNIHPNPVGVDRALYIEFGLVESKRLKMELYDQLGSHLFVLSNSEFQKGHFTTKVQLPGDLTTGVYVLRVSDGVSQYSKKIIVK